MYTGSCLCGGVRFRIHAELAPIQVCHCEQCRKAQGGPFATNIPVESSTFEWLAGRDLLRAFESTPGKLRHFCGTCGSPVYSERNNVPGVMRVRAGLLDGPLRTQIESHAYVASKANWWTIQDAAPQHAGGYVAKP